MLCINLLVLGLLLLMEHCRLEQHVETKPMRLPLSALLRRPCAPLNQLKRWRYWLGPAQAVEHLVGVVALQQGVMVRGGCSVRSRDAQTNGHSTTMRFVMYCIP